jgi:hypothetical protein
VSGENSVKIIDTADWKELPEEGLEMGSQVGEITWTQVLDAAAALGLGVAAFRV